MFTSTRFSGHSQGNKAAAGCFEPRFSSNQNIISEKILTRNDCSRPFVISREKEF